MNRSDLDEPQSPGSPAEVPTEEAPSDVDPQEESPVSRLVESMTAVVEPVAALVKPVNDLVRTVVGRFLANPAEDVEHPFDFWRLPNDPDSPHVGAMRDLFTDTFGMNGATFDAFLEPVPGQRCLLIVAASNHVIKGGLIYAMADNCGRAPAEVVDGGYIAFIATRRGSRARGAGRALLAFAHADFIVNGHTVSRLVRLDPAHTAFFEAAGYVRTEGGGYGDMNKNLDLSPESREGSQRLLNGLMTLY